MSEAQDSIDRAITIAKLQKMLSVPEAECIRAITVDWGSFLNLRAEAHWKNQRYFSDRGEMLAPSQTVDLAAPMLLSHPRLVEGRAAIVRIYSAPPEVPDGTIFTGGLIC